jgi:hypothetical protein
MKPLTSEKRLKLIKDITRRLSKLNDPHLMLLDGESRSFIDGQKFAKKLSTMDVEQALKAGLLN